jgi:hypothetical protein
MPRKRSQKSGTRQRGPEPHALILAGLDAMVDAMTRSASIIGRACRSKAKTQTVKAARALPGQIAALQHAGGLLRRGEPVDRVLGVAVRTVESLLPLLYERPAVMPRVLALSPVVRGAIAASTGPLPLILANLSPTDIDALIEALRALALALEAAAADASPDDARYLRVLAGRVALIIAALRSGATLVQLELMLAALLEEILALLTRLPPTVGRLVGSALTALLQLLRRLRGGGGLLFKALLAALVFLLSHLATRWVLENCRYEGARLWDLLDENPIFDWWYGVDGAALSRCDRLYRAFLTFRQQRRAAQAAAEDAVIISILAQAEAQALATWIDECVEDSQRASWQRELARIRALF